MKLLLFFFTLFTTVCFSQNNTVSAGGEATGSGGTSSYTVGQIAYSTNTGTNGNSSAQGVQQPFEISTTVGINETTINLELSLYPNPTVSSVTLKVENNEGLSFQVFDMQGKLINSNVITSNSTQINMSSYEPATYFIKITKNNSILKTFKVVKN